MKRLASRPLPWIQKLLEMVPNGHNTFLDHCMHGGSRDRASCFSYNPMRPNENMLQNLALKCDASHLETNFSDRSDFLPHKRGGSIPTHLARRLASIFLYWAKIRNLTGPIDLWNKLRWTLTRAKDSFSQVSVDHRGSGTDFVWKTIGFRASAISQKRISCETSSKTPSATLPPAPLAIPFTVREQFLC